MDLREIESLLLDNRDHEALQILQAMPDAVALEVMESLRAKDVEVRLSLPPLARARLGVGAATFLEAMALRDRHIDVRDAALDLLIEIAPDRAPRFWSSLRRRLQKGELDDADLAGWRLFELNDPLLGQELTEALQRWPDWYYIHKSFRVLSWCIEGATAEIEAHIREHDHDLMSWLVRAAWRMDRDDLWNAVAWVAVEAPDPQCRRYCVSALSKRGPSGTVPRSPRQSG